MIPYTCRIIYNIYIVSHILNNLRCRYTCIGEKKGTDLCKQLVYGKKEIETVSLEHRRQEIKFKEKKSSLNT